MKYLNVFTKREYEVAGVKKSQFYKVGFIKEAKNGNSYLTLFSQPGTEFFIFEQEEERLPDIQLER